MLGLEYVFNIFTISFPVEIDTGLLKQVECDPLGLFGNASKVMPVVCRVEKGGRDWKLHSLFYK